MQSPSGKGTPSKIRTALSEASELGLLRILSTSSERSSFGTAAKEYPSLFGSTKKTANKSQKSLREAVNNRRQYLLRNPAVLKSCLEERGFPVPSYIRTKAQENPQDLTSPSPARYRQPLTSPASQKHSNTTMPDDDDDATLTIFNGKPLKFTLDLDNPWSHPEGIFPILVTEAPVNELKCVSKIAIYV